MNGIDDRTAVPMTREERSVWALLVGVTSTTVAYLALMAHRLATQAAGDVSWVPAMIVAIAVSVAVTVAVTVVAEIAAAIRNGGVDAHARQVDQRDREIGRAGTRAMGAVLGPGLAVLLVLAMADADTVWIGNAAFVIGAIATVVEAVTRLRAYRRGF